MEKDSNPFPEFKIFDPRERVRRVGQFLFGSVVRAYMSEHYKNPDYEDEWQEIVTSDLEQANRWTSMGEYIDSDGEF
jgi:hypothetical protein